MVCMGNICRSPMAERVAAQLVAQARLSRACSFASAGTHSAHYKEPPDPRALAVLTRRGYAPGKGRSRPITDKDFAQFDLILAMDQSNMKELRRKCPGEHVHKLRLFLEFAPETGITEVPDPYYGAEQGFERVLDLCEAGSRGLIAHLKTQGY